PPQAVDERREIDRSPVPPRELGDEVRLVRDRQLGVAVEHHAEQRRAGAPDPEHDHGLPGSRHRRSLGSAILSEMKRSQRRADPYRDTNVIDERAPRLNQAVVGAVALLGVATGWWWLYALLALQLALGLTLGRRWCLACVAYF